MLSLFWTRLEMGKSAAWYKINNPFKIAHNAVIVLVSIFSMSEGDSNTGYRLVIDGKVELESGGENFGKSIRFTFGCNTPTLPPAVGPSSPPSSTGSSSCNKRVHVSLALTIGSLLWFTVIGE